MAVLNSKNGYPIWETTGRLDDVFLANFIPDQDNDTVADILSSHSQYTGIQANCVVKATIHDLFV